MMNKRSLLSALAGAFLPLTLFAQTPDASPSPTAVPDSPIVNPVPAGRGIFQDESTKTGPDYIAVMASFPEELTAIEAVMVPEKTKLESTRIKGIEFKAAEVDGRRYLFFLTGMSLVNASMNTQFVLDHFNVRAVFFTGIAGGINPAYSPGDVVVPAKWHYHSEAAYFNEQSPGQFALAGFFRQKYKNFGMIFPDDVTVIREGMLDWEQVPSFPADPALLAAAKRATDAMPPLKTGERVCKVNYGGTGSQARSFVTTPNIANGSSRCGKPTV